MRLSLATVIATASAVAGCVPSARVILPADAPVAQVRAAADRPVEELVGTNMGEVFAEDALRPCSDADDLRAARSAFAALDQRILGLDESAPAARVKKTTDELRALLATRCFELAGADLPDALEFDSGLAFKTWWTDGQGRRAIASYIDPGGIASLVVPASPRRTLIHAGNERSPLAPLLCVGNDPSCGRETTGWLRRAESYFAKSAPPISKPDDCANQLKTTEAADAWTTFTSCFVDAIPMRTTLPLGRFKPMTDGLLAVVDDYRGGCEAIDIYDLASGTALHADACQNPVVTVGRVPLASLREAAWVLAMADVATGDFRPTQTIAIPKGVVPGRPRESGTGERIGLGGLYATSKLRPWVWLRPKNGRFVGQWNGALWSVPAHDAAEYSAELLQIVEDGFVAGCAPSPPTAGAIDWSAPGPLVGEHPGNRPFQFDHPDYRDVEAALAKAKSPSRCTAPM